MNGPVVKESIVRVADWAAARGDEALVTLGLGSCVAIMLHDPQVGAGAMAHVLLPSRSLARDTSNPAKFPETAVPFLIEQLKSGDPVNRQSALDTLRQMSGQALGPHPEPWRRWWEANQKQLAARQ